MTATVRKKICIVLPGHWSDVMGGAQYQTKLLIRRLAATGRFDVTYVAKNVAPGYSPTDHEVVVLRGNWNPTRSLALDARPLLAALQRVAPDIVYYRGGSAYSGIAAYFANRTGKRSVWHIASDADLMPFRPRLSTDFLPRFLDRMTFRYCIGKSDCVVAQTRDQAQLLMKCLGRPPSATIYNFHPAPLTEMAKVGPLTVLWIGNLKPLKQPDIFVRLAAALAERTDARFVMIGALQGSRRWQRKLLRSIAETPQLEYRGAQSQADVNDALAKGHVLVNTSLYEGFSNTFVQAWGRGVPVVSLVVNPNGVFTTEQLGLLSGDESQMQRDVLRLVTEDGLREEIGLRARQYALDHHSERNIDRLIEVIEGSMPVPN